VEHIDSRCIETLSRYYGSVLPEASTSARPAILDLASSWISHLPKNFTKESAVITGIGLNKAELQANPVLSSYLVKDLNADPVFEGIEDASQDAIICSVSIGTWTLSFIKAGRQAHRGQTTSPRPVR
jgi:hypothetical protein